MTSQSLPVCHSIDDGILKDVCWYKRNGEYYAFDSRDCPIVGVVNIGGIKCGFDVNGKLLTGENEINGVAYTFTDNGILHVPK